MVKQEDRQNEEPANQAESIQRRRDSCLLTVCVGSTKLSYFACTQRHSKIKRALLFQLLNSHTKPVKSNSFSLPLLRKQNRTWQDCTRRNAFVSPASANTLQKLYPRPVTMATGAARRSESCQTVKVAAALVGSLAETSQPVGRQGLIPHSVPQIESNTTTNSLGLLTSREPFSFFSPHADALHPSTCSIFELPRPHFK